MKQHSDPNPYEAPREVGTHIRPEDDFGPMLPVIITSLISGVTFILSAGSWCLTSRLLESKTSEIAQKIAGLLGGMENMESIDRISGITVIISGALTVVLAAIIYKKSKKYS